MSLDRISLSFYLYNSENILLHVFCINTYLIYQGNHFLARAAIDFFSPFIRALNESLPEIIPPSPLVSDTL